MIKMVTLSIKVMSNKWVGYIKLSGRLPQLNLYYFPQLLLKAKQQILFIILKF